ncbi:4-azaleucine resistance transporter AzlC [Actinoplanes lutulentus]|uniref:AzlC family ABC transporter permease n=1 Tax=Actinoplanes lutulentus TaxID=1287878 RepID=UPI000DBA4F0D|nr:AzlC family ABC transporter permease [Actinoplanes lutulentus]MBB2940816.1 4-azaleucine resistance transporter AzlC [Actinoplanes lutulentus]
METARQRFTGGMRVGAGLAVAAFVLAITFGATAKDQGWSALAAIGASVLIFSGSAQFTLLAALAGSGGAGPAVGAALLINGRFLPMGLAVGPSLSGGRFRRALQGQAVVDGSWVAAHLGGGRFDRWRMFGATIVQWPAWVAGTAIGVVGAPSADLVERLGLDVVFPAFFLVLLLDEMKPREARPARIALAALIGAVVAAALLWWVPAGIALLGATVGALAGLRTRTPAPNPPAEQPPAQQPTIAQPTIAQPTIAQPTIAQPPGAPAPGVQAPGEEARG